MATKLGRQVFTLVSPSPPPRPPRRLCRGQTDSTRVYRQDLRNHGHSPHVRECSYEDLAADVKSFIQHEQKLEDCVVVGHSMCGHRVSLH